MTGLGLKADRLLSGWPAFKGGETNREVAAALKVAVWSVMKWAARMRGLGSAALIKMGVIGPV